MPLNLTRFLERKILSSTTFFPAAKTVNDSVYAHVMVVKLLFLTAALVGQSITRLSPDIIVEPDKYPNVLETINIFRTTVEDVYPFWLVVFVFTATIPDRFMKLLHGTLGTSVLLTNGTYERLDSQVALMVVDQTDTMLDLINDNPAVWDQMSHYVWLMPHINRSEASTLFRAAWQQRSVVNIVIVMTWSTYTYDPFKDVLREHLSFNVTEIRTVARQKMTDLNGHPVRICMFPTRLKAVKQPDGSYKGTDGMVVGTLAKHMNFTPIYMEPSDGKKYGWAELNSNSNFTYTGLLGDLVHDRVDMAFNGAFLKAYHSNNSIRYTTPVMFDEICFVVPKAQQMSQWRAVFTAFDVRLWYFLAATFVVALSAWTLIKRTTDTPYTLTLLSINLFRIFLMVPLNRVPKNVPERLMVVSTVLFGFITATSLQAVMVKYLSYPKYERDVASVQELYDTGMPVLSASTNLILLFEAEDNPLYTQMTDRFIIVKNKSLDILGEVASKRTSAAIGRKNDLVEKIARSYVKNNEVLLHIVEDCPRSFHIIYLVRRDSPFMNVINNIITIFVESGIVNSWFMHAKPFRPISDYHHQKDAHKVFTMKNVVIAFLCLAIGLSISGAAFAAELIYFHKFSATKTASAAATVRYPRNPVFTKRF
ncbi:Hypothetical protein CINCED_3A012314 [Cinara cedri]|uniref:Uncharacterized protein n=1 Tax=Cinara cedri TaxID=506608 RepID=A0A5E4ND73_9HEMI|nr:Hypothetical protein CINCED_3A012314 [Cinara cedri]